MAITSYPFDNQAVTETQYSQMFREFQDSGVVASYSSGSAFGVTAASGMQVTVAAGLAFVRGFMVQSTATEPLTIPTAGTSARVDRIILRLDPSTNSIVLAVLQGTAGSSTPTALTQTDTGLYEMELAQVTVGANVTSISSSNITPMRPVIGTRVGSWATRTRPASPRMGQIGYNNTTSQWEFWNGTAWASLVATVTWDSLSGIPATFAPAAHAHKWADITDRPSALPPAAHTHDWAQVTGKPTSYVPSAHGHGWDEISGKPSTYAPSTHSHTWSSITSKPSTFPPSSHSHSSYLESGDTIAWANGSKKPHSNSVSGSGTYYAVWVEGDGTFARNTSSRRFKQNIRDINVAPEAVLSLRPRLYDRRPKEDGGDYLRDEFGLIAEEVAETLPEIVTYDEHGRIDALRYDLLGVALLPVVQAQERRLRELEERLAALEAA
ncbi:tail fiber domain-containing protein [Streptomyces sp. KAI-26]|uniref:tail fiber domain-containing protein n=1 Tax=Streptomyces sp. KAI-26 TaxID=1169747 RepID=UPI001586FB6B|nr:tail fiber domain-containing protein [Streptomyces sp. KAI-26]NUV86587.1 tail fiber domain-containing protein [Streptomyces sp. KAI-26]NUW21218.1 tail fiber domain-containing protein [Streptomyces roseoviolaceus]